MRPCAQCVGAGDAMRTLWAHSCQCLCALRACTCRTMWQFDYGAQHWRAYRLASSGARNLGKIALPTVKYMQFCCSPELCLMYLSSWVLSRGVCHQPARPSSRQQQQQPFSKWWLLHWAAKQQRRPSTAAAAPVPGRRPAGCASAGVARQVAAAVDRHAWSPGWR
jgi:hypothetical protein